MKIATSILNAENRIACIKELNNTTTDYIHIDVMDNKFVPNYQLPVTEVNELGKYTNIPFDIHLMVEDPKTFINNLTIKNTQCLTIHLEIDKDIDGLISYIKTLGIEVGIAIKPNTDIDLIDKYINQIDKVLIMSVEPGFGGQAFLESSIGRIKAIRNKRQDLIIEVDGGINDMTINKIKGLIDIAVVGSYITKNDDYQKAINNLKN